MKLDKVYTEDRKLIVGKNDLKTWCEQNPEIGQVIMKEWNSKANGNMTEFKAGSYFKASFRCSICGKPYEKVIRNKVMGGLHDECGSRLAKEKIRKTMVKKLGREKNLAIQCPDIAKEWDYSRNKGFYLLPENMSINSNKRVWWRCSKCKDRYQMCIRQRTLLGYGCRECRKKIKIKVNSTIIE